MITRRDNTLCNCPLPHFLGTRVKATGPHACDQQPFKTATLNYNKELLLTAQPKDTLGEPIS